MLVECFEMFLFLRDFLIICMLIVEVLEIVDVDGEDCVEVEVIVVDMEELVVDWLIFLWFWNSKVVLVNLELE